MNGHVDCAYATFNRSIERVKGSLAVIPLAVLALVLGSGAVAQPGSTAGTTARPSAAKPAGPSGNASWERAHRASKIIGTDVVNRQGEKVGDIEDIVLDRNGNVAYAVVSTGGFLGVGDRLNAVPWRSLQTDTATDHFILDIDREQLARAPGFDSNTFPDMNDAKWSAENRKHFPVASNSARWSSRTTGSAASSSNASSGTGRSSSNDVGTTTSTSRRTGTAAGPGASAHSDTGTATGTTSGITSGSSDRGQPGAATSNATGSAATNPSGVAGGTVNPAAVGGTK